MADQRERPASEFILGFLALFETEAGDGRYGAAMVTDDRGVPLEFRASTPVRPSALHRTLYGESLWPFVEAELIAQRLVAELRIPPPVVLTNRIGILDTAIDATLCFIADADASIPAIGSELFSRYLEATGATHAKLTLAAATDSALVHGAKQVTASMRRFDPIEVFRRIDQAYEQLAVLDERYR